MKVRGKTTQRQVQDLAHLTSEAREIIEELVSDDDQSWPDVAAMRRHIVAHHRPAWFRAAGDLATASMLHTSLCRVVWIASQIDDVAYTMRVLVRVECKLAATMLRRMRDRELRRAAHKFRGVYYRERTRDAVTVSILHVATHLVARLNRRLNAVDVQPPAGAAAV